jgi:transcriptional regulator with PAS, ATPase and Fis domain
VRRIGAERDRKLDVRIIAATNMDLKKAVEEKRFRGDLYHRLNVLAIRLPPLRDRNGDLELLAANFLREYSKDPEARLAEGEMEALSRYPWPGNVRELRNLVERSVLVQRGPRYRLSPFLASEKEPASASDPRTETAPGTMPLDEVERVHIRAALHAHGGNLTRAAKVLGISLSTMKRKVAEYGLR